MNNTGLGALVSTTSQINGNQWTARNINPALIAGRGAFLGLIRLNVWGLATLLSKKAFEVSKATTDAQPNGKKWWDVGAKFRNGWFNLGGTWDKFVSAVNAGKNKKALGFKLAPAGIKAKLKAQGIGSYSALGSYNQGIGAVDIAATAAAASAIYLALKPIIDDLFDKFKSDVPDDFIDEFEDTTTSTTASTTGSSLMSGSGTIIGLAALAAIYFGTMSKK